MLNFLSDSWKVIDKYKNTDVFTPIKYNLLRVVLTESFLFMSSLRWGVLTGNLEKLHYNYVKYKATTPTYRRLIGIRDNPMIILRAMLASVLSTEESPDDLDKNHQVKVDAHLVM